MPIDLSTLIKKDDSIHSSQLTEDTWSRQLRKNFEPERTCNAVVTTCGGTTELGIMFYRLPAHGRKPRVEYLDWFFVTIEEMKRGQVRFLKLDDMTTEDYQNMGRINIRQDILGQPRIRSAEYKLMMPAAMVVDGQGGERWHRFTNGYIGHLENLVERIRSGKLKGLRPIEDMPEDGQIDLDAPS